MPTPEAWGMSRDVIHPTRYVSLTSRPAEVCPINWIQLIKSPLGFFSLRKATSLGEEKLWIQTSFSPLKKLIVSLILSESEGKYLCNNKVKKK